MRITRLLTVSGNSRFRSGIVDAMATWFEGDTVHRAEGENFFAERPTNAAYRPCELCYDLLRDHGRSTRRVGHRSLYPVELPRFESGGIAAAHSVHSRLTQLGDTHHATHGEKVSFGIATQLLLEDRSDEFVGDVIEFSVDLGLPVTLAEQGFPLPQPGT